MKRLESSRHQWEAPSQGRDGIASHRIQLEETPDCTRLGEGQVNTPGAVANMNQQLRVATKRRKNNRWGVVLGVLLCAPLFLAWTPSGDLEIKGKLLYGTAAGARTGAVVDLDAVFAKIPVYMYMKAQGYSETEPQGRPLFDKARKTWKTTLAMVAVSKGVDVVTAPGEVVGGDIPVRDLTQDVIGKLPKYYIHGTRHYGRNQSPVSVATVASARVLNQIPAYREFKKLSPRDASYHLLGDEYEKIFTRALTTSAREGLHEVVVEMGGVTSRLGYVPDITDAVIRNLSP